MRICVYFHILRMYLLCTIISWAGHKICQQLHKYNYVCVIILFLTEHITDYFEMVLKFTKIREYVHFKTVDCFSDRK